MNTLLTDSNSILKPPTAPNWFARRRYLPRRSAHQPRHQPVVGLCGPTAVIGSRRITNDDLLNADSERTAEDIFRRTGIATRPWIAAGEDALQLAVRASHQLLEREGVRTSQLDAVICATSTPSCVTPSLACHLLHQLNGDGGHNQCMAYDINAACSGFLYALRNAFDLLQNKPHGRVMIVTSEVLSPLLDPDDIGTRCLFGDAASATIVSGPSHVNNCWARMHRPIVSSKPEDGSLLSVPFPGQGYIRMQGRKVFEQAVRAMFEILSRSCLASQRTLHDLDMAVPHQANQRILDSVGRHCPAPIFSNIMHLGNTASSSIPLALQDICQSNVRQKRLGLCTFGGGFTSGAALLELQ